MNPDGSNPTRLTDSKPRSSDLLPFEAAYDVAPIWSPDGSKIAFGSNNKLGVYTMNADGSDVRLLIDESTSVIPEAAPQAWSPDGTKLALVGGHPINVDQSKAYVDIYIINADGSNPVQLTKDTRGNSEPTWSPDGKQIAFSSDRDDGRRKIYVMNADGSNQHVISSPADANRLFRDESPSWSPDGTKIAFVGSRASNLIPDGSDIQIYVMNPDGSNVTPLTNERSTDYFIDYSHPKWSPDGAKIVFERKLSNYIKRIDLNSALFVMNSDGSNMVEISNINSKEFGDLQPDWQPLLAPSTEPPPSVLGFSAPSYSAYEDSGTIQINVTRTGNLTQSASCSYATEDGTATVKRNYAPALGTLRFAPGEATKTISILLTDNGHALGNTSFKIKLNDNEGNATFFGGNKETTITVLDRDTAPRAANPIDDARYFVRMQYVDFLNREPDQGGWDYWTKAITDCGTNIRCINAQRVGVSAAFFIEQEYQDTGFFIYRFKMLNPQFSPLNFQFFMRDVQTIVSGAVGQPDALQRLEANKMAYIRQYFDDDRVAISFGFTNEQYVDLLFKYAQLTPIQAERDALVNGLNAGTETRPTVFRKFLENERFKRQSYNQAFVLMQYFGYLRRDPDASGYQFWLNVLNNRVPGNYRSMVCAFITSAEYQDRFSPIRTRTDNVCVP